MAHIFLMTRGIKNDVEDYINWLSHQQLPYKNRESQETALQDYLLQIRVCPIQLWDISFPREHKDLMLTSLFSADGKPYHSNIQKYLSALRFALKADKMPEKWDTSKRLPRRPANTEMICIGTKEDEVIKHTDETEKI